MGALVESLPWECQPGEEEDAYAAFLVYRDLGPWRTHETTRRRLLKGPGYLNEIDRWSAQWDWRERVGTWDEHLQAGRERADAEFAALWERRRLHALEDGWQLCRALRARLAQMMALTPETPEVAPPEALPEVASSPEPSGTTPGRKAVRGNDLMVMRLAKLVVELEWGLIAQTMLPPGKIDPLTATPEELKAYLTLNPRLKRPPPR